MKAYKLISIVLLATSCLSSKCDWEKTRDKDTFEESIKNSHLFSHLQIEESL